MGFLTGSPKIEAPKPPPAVPQIDEAVSMRNEQDRNAARRRGAATTLLTSPTGLPNLGATSAASASGM